MEDYSAAMDRAVRRYREEGVTHFIFGDIFPARRAPLPRGAARPCGHRGRRTALGREFGAGHARFPLVGTQDRRRDDDGRRAGSRSHRPGDRRRLRRFAARRTDPNGENGEYHTFCYDGPIFREAVPFRLGKPFAQSYDIRLDDGSVRTYGYWFADLQAAE